ncbi:MAG: GTP-binding protein EngB [Chlamydiae bacterium]|nr:GTP-binding protein EngB [Chlamydiota bacterium]
MSGVTAINRVIMDIDQRKYEENSNVDGKDIVLLIGNTGAGKSTLINYLFECKMRRRAASPEEVTPVIECEAPIAAIEHGMVSGTVYPTEHFHEKSGVHFYDCPGFMDTGGSAKNIINAVAIKNLAVHAKSVRIMVVIDYHSLIANRAREIVHTISIIHNLIGANFDQFASSILVVFTKVPPEINAEKIQAILKNEPKIFPAALLDRVVIYDPLDNPQRIKNEGFITRMDLIKKVKNSEEITNATETFSIAVDTHTDLKLSQALDELKKEIKVKFNPEKRFRDLKGPLVLFNRLKSIIEIKEVQDAHEEIQEHLSLKIKLLYKDADLSTLKQLKQSISPEFDDEIDEAIANLEKAAKETANQLCWDRINGLLKPIAGIVIGAAFIRSRL